MRSYVLDLLKTVVDNRQEWRRLIRTVCESHDVKTKKSEGGGEWRREKETKEVKTIKFYCVISVVLGLIGVAVVVMMLMSMKGDKK